MDSNKVTKMSAREVNKALLGYKPMKDELTLMLCGNSSVDFKPLFEYNVDNPFACHKAVFYWVGEWDCRLIHQFIFEAVASYAVKDYLMTKYNFKDKSNFH